MAGTREDDMRATNHALRSAGVLVEETKAGLRIGVDGPLKPVTLSTAPFPALPDRNYLAVV